MFSLTKFFLWD